METGKRLRTRVENDRTLLCRLLVFVYRSVTQLTHEENATSVKEPERDERRYIVGGISLKCTLHLQYLKLF